MQKEYKGKVRKFLGKKTIFLKKTYPEQDHIHNRQRDYRTKPSLQQDIHPL